jgi:hypothetical protein
MFAAGFVTLLGLGQAQAQETETSQHYPMLQRNLICTATLARSAGH